MFENQTNIQTSEASKMAGKSGIARQLERVRSKFVQELDINKVFPRLLKRGIFTVSEEERILEPTVPQKRIDLLLDIISKKDSNVFFEFCKTLEECDPHLLTVFVLDTLQGRNHWDSVLNYLMLYVAGLFQY